MNLDDFKKAMALVLMRRLKWNDWDAANLMRENASKIERAYHEGATPLETIGACLGRELDEEHVTPEEAVKMLGHDPRQKVNGLFRL